jgi:hypothetical protein
VPLNASQWTGHFADGRPYNASLAIFDPRKLSIALSPNGCVDHAPVSATAKFASCAYAVNGGFFDNVDRKKVVDTETGLLAFARNNYAELMATVEAKPDLSKDVDAGFKKLCEEFFATV